MPADHAKSRASRKFIFLYNADGGRWANVVDSARKMAGSTRACSLCTITHGLFRKRAEWQRLEEGLGAPVEYFHRDDMSEEISAFVRTRGLQLPAVILESGGRLQVLVDSESLVSCRWDPGCLGAKLDAALAALL